MVLTKKNQTVKGGTILCKLQVAGQNLDMFFVQLIKKIQLSLTNDN